MSHYIKLLISLPKTIWFNLKCFVMSGIRLPILVAYNVKCKIHRAAYPVAIFSNKEQRCDVTESFLEHVKKGNFLWMIKSINIR